MERLRVSGRRILPHKAIMKPGFTERTVLTLAPWTFVDLWLKREHHKNAAIYWEQARQFHEASNSLPMQSAPLLLYYSFLNAAKSLLEVKGVAYTPMHGVEESKASKAKKKVSLSGTEVKFRQNGVIPSLSRYFQEAENGTIHSLQDLLYNLPHVHRTFCLTYKSRADMFFPLKECEYVFDPAASRVRFRGEIGNEVPRAAIEPVLPPALEADPDRPNGVRSSGSIPWAVNGAYSAQEIVELQAFHRSLRSDIYYINGAQTLWYVKTKARDRIDRRSPTLILAAMHRLSEICRYRPVEMLSFMSGQRNWLLSEFVTMSSNQFFDEVASEITGYQFLVPNVRPAA